MEELKGAAGPGYTGFLSHTELQESDVVPFLHGGRIEVQRKKETCLGSPANSWHSQALSASQTLSFSTRMLP